MFLWEQLFINISVILLYDKNSGICGGIPFCCIASIVTVAPFEEIPVPSSEAWDTLLSDDGEIPVSEVREIGMDTGSTQTQEPYYNWKCYVLTI